MAATAFMAHPGDDKIIESFLQTGCPIGCGEGRHSRLGCLNMRVEFSTVIGERCIDIFSQTKDMTACNSINSFGWGVAAALMFSAICTGISSPASAQNQAQLKIDGAVIDITFDSTPTATVRQLLIEWITKAANAVDIYYARFPVSHVEVHIKMYEGHGARSGHTSGWNGPEISVSIGKYTTAVELADPSDDWLMTHEMVHLAFPSVAERHHWIEEGLATYVEPVARVRAGELTAQRVWSGDRGLDHTATWGRTYWGGALFCFLADIEIRKRTKNKEGLENALRGILKAGGSIETEGELTQVWDTADAAIGVSVLHPLYDHMKATPVAVDLAHLWQQLGVEKRGDEILLHDDAPLAAIRKAITQQ